MCAGISLRLSLSLVSALRFSVCSHACALMYIFPLMQPNALTLLLPCFLVSFHFLQLEGTFCSRTGGRSCFCKTPPFLPLWPKCLTWSLVACRLAGLYLQGWLGLSCLGFALIRALPLVRSFAVLVLRLLLGVRCLFALDRFRLRCFRLKFQHGRPDALGQGVYAPGVQTLGIDYPRKFAS